MNETTDNAARRTPPGGRLAALAFLLVVLGAPVAETGWSLAHGERPHVLGAFRGLATRTDAQRIDFEESLHEASLLSHTVLPHYQQWMLDLLGIGNRKVAVGRDGWLFLREDLDFAYGPGCFTEGRAGQKALDVITDFRRQLADRDIDLLIVLVCGKELSDPEQLSSRTAALAQDEAAVRGASRAKLDEFCAKLDAARVEVVRVDEVVDELRRAEPSAAGRPRYLPRDVHWTPETMRAVAKRVAERAVPLLGARPEDDGRLALGPPQPFAGEGDLVRMLGLAHPESSFPPMEMTLVPVLDTKSGAPVAPERASEILLLGDSFTKVYSDPALELGSGAGLAEHLAFELKQPLDVIALAGGATTAVRASLAQSAERLASKRLVIWEFAARFLAHTPEEWQPIALPKKAAAADTLAEPFEIVGEITEVTRIPDSFDYAFCLATYEYKVVRTLEGKAPGDRVWVAFPAIVDRKSTAARSFAVGARHRLRLEPLSRHYDLDKTSFIDDTHAEAPLLHPLEWSVDAGK